MSNIKKKVLIILAIIGALAALAVIAVVVIGLGSLDLTGEKERPTIDRTTKIPATVVKVTPATDAYPPILHSNEYESPVPLPGSVNTAGAEDSPFIADDGTLYFFFTPDVSVPVEQQLRDEVTGIYSSRPNGEWGSVERIYLQDEGKEALDGCEFVQGNEIWFCSARAGYTGIHWFTARRTAGVWSDWQNADFDPTYEVGELHISGEELYFHSPRAGGKGGLDIWMSQKTAGVWQAPTNLSPVNSAADEGWLFLTSTGSELWFTRTYRGAPAVYRSRKINGSWQAPELIVSQFAGEPTLDAVGNLYFVHHFYKDNQMIEADIYLAKKK